MKKYALKKGWTKTSLIKYIKQNFKGKSENTDTHGHTECVYHGDSGKKCAVGLFIPDNKYNASFETVPASKLIRTEKLSQFMPLSAIAMETMQAVHDQSDPNETLNDLIDFVQTRTF